MPPVIDSMPQVVLNARRIAKRMGGDFLPKNPIYSPLLFIGEKPSETAHANGWTWASRKLAAKKLSESLGEIGIPWERCHFLNLFGDRPDCPEAPNLKRLVHIGIDARAGIPIIAMGQKVHTILYEAGIKHRTIVHPAARGAIRKRQTYVDHLREVLA